MISYRNQLQKIGYEAGIDVSYRTSFKSRPTSLRQAMRSMDAPTNYDEKKEVKGGINEAWTEEIQGVVWDGSHWIFSSNGSQPLKDKDGIYIPPIGSSPKALYTFNGKTNFKKPNKKSVIAAVIPIIPTGNIQPVIPLPSQGWIHHVGPMLYHDGLLYVEHWNDKGGQLMVFADNDGNLSFIKWIDLRSESALTVEGGRVGLVGINPWDNNFYTCHGDLKTDKLFIHRMNGLYTGRGIDLKPPIDDGGYVQGGFFSPNGHIYIASGREGVRRDHQYIYCYSALNGYRFDGRIEVLAEESNQELEGICYANVTRNGQQVQIHAVLLENFLKEKDNIFFKSFTADRPDLI